MNATELSEYKEKIRSSYRLPLAKRSTLLWEAMKRFNVDPREVRNLGEAKEKILREIDILLIMQEWRKAGIDIGTRIVTRGVEGYVTGFSKKTGYANMVLDSGRKYSGPPSMVTKA